MEKVNINEHLTYKKLFKINIGPILMMLFISTYGIVDGLFIANFSMNPSSFAGVNLIFPLIMIIGGIGFMFGSGGSALVSKRLGEGKNQLANETFTNIFLSATILGIILSIFGVIFTPQIAELLASVTDGSTPDMVSEAIKYGRIMIGGITFFMIQNLFQTFMMVDEKPNLAFSFTLISGVLNIILDYVFIVLLKMGCQGAALGTVVGYIVGSVGPLIYFFIKKDGNIFFTKPTKDAKSVLQSCYNGMSEFFSNISNNIVSVMMNFYLLIAYGELGVSAYGICLYVMFIFIAIFIGYCIGTTPYVGYNYGSENKEEIKNILKKSITIISIISLIMAVLGLSLAEPIVSLFSKNDPELQKLSVLAFRWFSLSFAFSGLSMYISSFFTGLGNGTVSAILSTFRTFVFQVIAILLLPLIFGTYEALWYVTFVAEGFALVFSIILLFKFRNKYGY